MSPEKEALLQQTYTIFKKLVFFDFPIDQSIRYLDENLMGYGTHIDEKIFGIPKFNELLELQRKESVGLDMKVKETPVFKREMVQGDAALFIEEIDLSMTADGNAMSINCRLTTVLEYFDDKWLVVHFHGSLAQGNEGDNDTWSVNELKEKNKQLEQKVAERTEELRISLENLKATQSQLIHSEKMASLGELTAGIAHEIKNPLNFVNNFAEVSAELIDELNEELEKGDLEEVKLISTDLQQNMEKINRHGKRADSIVKGMLQHSRSSSGHKELTDINELADEYLRLSYHGLRAQDKSFNADYKTDFDKNIPRVNVVPQEIGRVLLNLYNNAFYAVNERLSSSGEDFKPMVHVSTRSEGGMVAVSVSDNGPGIPDEIRDKIFQPFFTSKPTGQGTGLGLSMSYDIAKSHGGTLSVTSEPGKGTVFIIKIPKK